MLYNLHSIIFLAAKHSVAMQGLQAGLITIL